MKTERGCYRGVEISIEVRREVQLKRLIILTILGLFLSSTATSGILGDYLKVKASLESRKTSGSTLLHLSFTERFSYFYIDDLTQIDSEIEYPLDTYMGGGHLSFIGKLKGDLKWLLNLSYFTNLKDPTKPALDSDWLKSLTYDFDEKFSYTESDNTLKATDIDINVAFNLANKPKFTISAAAGYMYQKFSFKAFGIDGWYLTYENDQYDSVYYQEYNDTLVLINKYTYHIPYLALQSQIRAINPINLNLNLGFSPLTFGRDFDDHVLRKKTGEGTCSGATLILSGDIEWPFWKRQNGSDFSINLGYRYLSISTSGEQRQEFYGDDPGTSDDETGLFLRGIDYDLKSSQKSLTFSITGTF
ncbi:MAG: omptin family outer membrane protease [Candidatus Zixiibacteriota bacterium]